MSRKRTVYSAEFKTKLVLEVLKEDKTLNEIVSANNINLHISLHSSTRFTPSLPLFLPSNKYLKL